MSDDVQLVDAASVTSAVAMDELSTLNGVDVSATHPKAQRMKIVAGDDGIGQDVSATHPLPVTGSVTADTELTTADLDTGAGTDTRAVVGIARAESGGAVLVGSANPLPTSNTGIGATTDVEATGDGSIVAILKRLRTLLNGGLPAALGGSGGLKTEIVSALPAGTNVVGHVVVDSVPAASVSTDSIAAAPYAEVSLAGATPYKLNSAASTNATSLKASAGKLYFLAVVNTNAAVRYLKFYNKASAPTVGTDTPVLTFPIPGNTAGAGFMLALPMPMKFSTGIAFALTTGAADSDTGAVAANEIVVNLGWV